MFKRLFWLTIGMGVGFGGSFWVTRRVRATVDRYRPEQLSAAAGDAARQLGSDVRAALTEGREAMVEREAELRARLEPRLPPRPS
ncbi:MAG: hypothetical protein WKF93_04900 [Acidimicrobiales bacterium]